MEKLRDSKRPYSANVLLFPLLDQCCSRQDVCTIHDRGSMSGYKQHSGSQATLQEYKEVGARYMCSPHLWAKAALYNEKYCDPIV